MAKLVYDFTEGNKDLKDLLGGKGANLAEMTNLGLPVPPGFIITTEACREYLREGAVPAGLADEVGEHLRQLEEKMGRQLGDPADPLLVSVRSGAKFSMPGMMETVLNIGLSDESVHGLAKQSGNERFAWDAYRRLIQMFGKTVLGIDGEAFEHAIDEAKQAKGTTQRPRPRRGGPARDRGELQGHRARAHGPRLPAGPARADGPRGARRVQLVERRPRRSCTGARSGSRPTSAPRSTSWRWSSATSAWTPAPASRSPATPAPASRASTATTCRTRRARTWWRASATPSRCRTWRRSTPRPTPSCWTSCGPWRTTTGTCATSSSPSSAASSGCCRPGWASAPRRAAFRIATQLVDQGLIDMDEALTRVTGDQLAQLMFPRFDLSQEPKKVTTGVSASPGAAVGKAVFDSAKAVERAAAGEAVILVRRETNPDDLHGMIAARGILTSRGGKTSHAAVVARGHGQDLRLRRRGARGGHPGRAVHRAGRRDRQRGRRAVHRRHQRRRLPRRGAGRRLRRSCEYFEEGLERGRGRPDQGGGPDHEARRRAAPPRRPRQRGHRRGLRPGPPVRRERGRPGPHRAHVPRRAPPAGRAAHPGRGRGGPAGRAGRARAAAARRLRGDPGRDGRPAGHHPADRPAAARVPARPHRHVGQGGPGRGRRDRAGPQAARRGAPAARAEPHARPARRPARPGHPRAAADAGPRDRARRGRAEEGGQGPEAGGHDPADRLGAGDGDRPGRDGRRCWPRSRRRPASTCTP